MEVNGKFYSLWGQFVERQGEWIGGELEDFGDSIPLSIQAGIQFDESMKTVITGITLEPNGETSAMFSIDGKDFDCGFDVRHGGVMAGEEGWITFSGYGGHKFRIKKPKKS